ncbi:MAG: hypothetical protein KDA89_08245 [Planctomycetaceae bacterium]|nr:hypothetical protein [Planctomycetaceae bacterium]
MKRLKLSRRLSADRVFVSGGMLLLLVLSSTVEAQNVRPTIMTRLFWQDAENQTLSYADLYTTNTWNLKRGWVQGFPEAAAGGHRMGAMVQAKNVLMVPLQVAATGDGAAAAVSWLTADSGAFEEPHGNHFHWRYTRTPSVTHLQAGGAMTGAVQTRVFDETFLVSGDVSNQIQSVGVSQVGQRTSGPVAASFAGGGAAPVIAAAGNSVAYAAWSDADGDHAGQVDVIHLKAGTRTAPVYSLRLPSGGIHQATVNSGKVFFATSSGLSFVSADLTAAQQPQSVEIGEVVDVQPAADGTVRVSAFDNQRNWVMYVKEGPDGSHFCLIDAASSHPREIRIALTTVAGLRPGAPRCVLSLGQRFAFLFQESVTPAGDGDAAKPAAVSGAAVAEQLTVISLDPNGDRDFSDAVVKQSVPVGRSRIDGERGHHDICFDAYGRFAIFTNPGDGLLTVMSVRDLKQQAQFRVEGVPDRILAFGAPEHFH